MAKYILKEIETDEDFIEAFGENPMWIFSVTPQAKKSRIGKRRPASMYNSETRTMSEADNEQALRCNSGKIKSYFE